MRLSDSMDLEKMKMLSSLFEEATDSIFAVDSKGKVLFFNKAAYEARGYTSEDMSKMTFIELISPNVLEEVEREIKVVQLKGENTFEAVDRRKDGSEMPVEVHARIVSINGQKMALCVVRDITERRKGEEIRRESEQLYRTLFDNTDDGFILLEPLYDESGGVFDFRFLKVNRSYERQTGRKASVVEGNRARVVAPELEPEWVSLVGRVDKSGGSVRYENFNERTGRWYDAYYFSFAKGKVGILFRDITERKKAEQILSKKEHELNCILDSSPTIIFYKDKAGKFIQANRAFGEALNMPKEELLGKTVFDLYSVGIAQGMANDDFAVLESKRPKLGIVEPYESPSGLRWIRTDKIPSFDEDGEVTGLIGFSEDITERRNAEISLKESEEKYRNLVENSKDAIAVVDFKGNVIFANKAAESLTGYSMKDKINRNIRIITPKKLWPKSVAMLLKARMGKIIPYFEYELKRKDGTIIPVETGGQAIYKNGKPVAVQIITRDITERKKAEEALLESETKYRELVDRLPEMVFEIDKNGRIVFANLRAVELLGYSKRKIEHDFDANRLVAAEDVARSKENMKLMFANGERQSTEYVFVRKDGTHFPVLLTSAPIIKDKKIVGIRGIGVDITERKKTQEALKESEERYHQLFSSMTEMFFVAELVFDKNHKVTDFIYSDCNPALLKSMKKAREQVIGKRVTELFGSVDNLWLEEFGRIERTGEAIHAENQSGGIGNYFNVYAWKVNSRQVGVIFEDITHRKALEKQLQDNERMAAIGQTAGMVGHDLRNPLQSIIGEVYLAESELRSFPDSAQKESLRESIKAIAEQTSYMDKIVSDLQTFVKPVEVHKEIVDIKELIIGVLDQIETPNIQTSMHLKNHLAVNTDPQLLKRVFINLVTNSVQAMPKGGNLTVTTQSFGTEHIQIIVEDTGIGISDEIKPKIFAPLFTTKAKGQGFGLAVCKRIIEAQGGTITFESQEGKGTKFVIQLPMNANQNADAK